MYESNLAASSTLSKAVRTAMSKLIKKMTLLFSIYNVDFRNLVQEHELDVR